MEQGFGLPYTAATPDEKLALFGYLSRRIRQLLSVPWQLHVARSVCRPCADTCCVAGRAKVRDVVSVTVRDTVDASSCFGLAWLQTRECQCI